MREALQREIPVVTSNKWPVALRGVQLAALARSKGVAFRAESTVMSATPVLGTLIDGLAGPVPVALRGLLNATANFILSQMADGQSYAEALAGARRAGLAERDLAADVEGHDAVAKVMILSGLVFGRQLEREQVAIIGPGAGPQLAGQGVLSDIIAVARARAEGRGRAGSSAGGGRGCRAGVMAAGMCGWSCRPGWTAAVAGSGGAATRRVRPRWQCWRGCEHRVLAMGTTGC